MKTGKYTGKHFLVIAAVILVVLLALTYCQPSHAGGWQKANPGSHFDWYMCTVFPDLKWCKANQ
jgi:hypothetical protein